MILSFGLAVLYSASALQAVRESHGSMYYLLRQISGLALGVVLFAAALFFAGISTKLDTPGLRRALLVFGVVLFLATLAWIATFPISLSV